MSKKIRLGLDSLRKIKKGVNALAEAVKVTLGPSGRTVILYRGLGSHHVTKDGVTVAKDVELEDSVENMASSLVKQVASKTAELAGDGTTTSIVLIQGMFNKAYKFLIKKKLFWGLIPEKFTKVNPMDLKKGMEKAVANIITCLKFISIKVTKNHELKNIAMISSNGDESMGTLLFEIYDKLGTDVKITRDADPSTTGKDFHNITEGYTIDRGYLSPSFTNERDGTLCRLKDPIFALIPGLLKDYQIIIPYLETSFLEKRPLVVLADDYDSKILDMLVKNNLNPKSSSILALRTPGMGGKKAYNMEDFSAVIGYNSPISNSIPSNLKGSNLGTCKEIISTSEETNIIVSETNKDSMEKHIAFLETSLSEETDKGYIFEVIEDRLSKLKGKIAVITLHASTEGELLERIDRLDDAIEATKSAIEEGYIAGGGLPLYRVADYMSKNLDRNILTKDELVGYLSVLEAIKEPFNTIITNGGLNPLGIYKNIPVEYPNINLDPKNKFYTVGYNSKKGVYEDLILKGVIDPVKVTRIALQNAVSTSGLLLTTGCTISLN
jgi:chaperonin GroEL